MVEIIIRGESIETHREVALKSEDGGQDKAQWQVPEEVPVAFVFNRRNYAIMLATPADLVDFAIGFSISEPVVENVDQIKSIEIIHAEVGVDIRIEISKDRLERLDVVQRRRNMVGSASCGLCGLENADTLLKKLDKVTDEKASVEDKVLNRALDQLADFQPLNNLTHSVHAAGWADDTGNVVTAREDVGRHNALDKLIGSLAQLEEFERTGFVVMSSRCSYELIEKAATFGIKAMVTVSAPTAFALQKAKQANIALYSRSKSGVVEPLL